jgi:hypothetical protein
LNLEWIPAVGDDSIAVNPDISQEFGFGRPFCPAAAFSVKKVLTVLFKYASGPF